MRRLLLIFLKFPEPGRVKTRIAAESSPERAAEIYQEMAETVLSRIENSGHSDLRVLFDPPERRTEVRAWIEPLGTPIHEFRPQVDGDLGARLAAAFKDGFEDKYEQVAVIGTDSPEIESRHIENSWAALGDGNDAAFGPALDGGFYLLALKRPTPSLFDDIQWSQTDTLEQCLLRMRNLGLESTVLSALHDIDTLADWNRYLDEKNRSSASR